MSDTSEIQMVRSNHIPTPIIRIGSSTPKTHETPPTSVLSPTDSLYRLNLGTEMVLLELSMADWA